MKQRELWKDITGYVLFGISLFLLGISLFLCGSSDIWYDELFTMGMTQESFKGLVYITSNDVHPPLYYILVKLVLDFLKSPDGATQVIAAKLVSMIPFGLCLVYAMTIVRKHFGMLTAGLFSFLLMTMPNLPEYTVEVRMYGWSLFFILGQLLHSYLLIGSQKEEVNRNKFYVNINIVAVTLYALASCYTHYFACVAAFCVFLFTLIVMKYKKSRYLRSLLCGGVFCGICYLPWVLQVVTHQVHQVKENYWIPPVSIRTLGGCVKYLCKPILGNAALESVIAVLVFGVYIILVICYFYQKRKQKQVWNEADFLICGAIGSLIGIVLFGFGASLLLRPIFVYRYMMPAVGVFWLAFAILFSKVSVRKGIQLLILLGGLVVGVLNYKSFYGEEMWKRVQMTAAKDALESIQEKDVVICNFDQMQAVASFYLPEKCQSFLWYGTPEQLIREMYPQNHALVEGTFSDEKGYENLREIITQAEGNVWFLGSGNAREEIIEKWKKQGIYAKEVASIMVERYWVNLYTLTM